MIYGQDMFSDEVLASGAVDYLIHDDAIANVLRLRGEIEQLQAQMAEYMELIPDDRKHEAT